MKSPAWIPVGKFTEWLVVFEPMEVVAREAITGAATQGPFSRLPRHR